MMEIELGKHDDPEYIEMSEIVYVQSVIHQINTITPISDHDQKLGLQPVIFDRLFHSLLGV
ncbi:hypothetical protein J4399_01965 [Candidatus Woesearchaeota archaeon]|nr:hypothetical protein [Candidatus Woesearchaeota archaeon]